MLEMRRIAKRYGATPVLHDVSLTVHGGEFYSLLGPSGCGKSTLLRILAGLEFQDSGTLSLDGQSIDASPAHARPFNMVFQRYALFPHLSVWRNIAFGLEVKGVAKREIGERVDEALALVGLEDLAGRHIATLSGGQQQRVALARAIVNRPRVLLLDEPLSALDLKLRQRMQSELRALQRRLAMTFIFVTHAQDEALALSDRVAVMHAGRVEQVDSPCVLYERPRTPFTATFVGKSNRLVGRITELTGGYATLAAAGCEVRGLAVGELRVGEIAACFVRPERMRLLDGAGARSAAPSAEAEPIAAKVTLAVRGVSFGGAFLELEGIIEGGEERDLWTVPLWAGEGAAERLPPEGARVMVGWRADDASIMPYGPAAFAASGDAGEGAP